MRRRASMGQRPSMNVLVTGSSGLVGSEAVRFYDERGADVIGIDNNMRAMFFGPGGDTMWNLRHLQASTSRFTALDIDIRDQSAIFDLFRQHRFDLIVHWAGQPSHDKAREIPLLDFEVNALGTVHLLEATRLHAPDATFALMSTNKVYGDAPNELPLVEQDTRWAYARAEDRHGVSEHCRIDQSLHSLFAASKTGSDVMAQEYGRSYGLNVGIFRCGCLTGPSHSGVELHGFLSYLAKATVTGRPYTIFGYKGKQVRDHLHSLDVIHAVDAFADNPRPGEVYNLGGGNENSASVLEAIALVEAESGRGLQTTYSDESRIGDHICYISDCRKFARHYPQWAVTVGLDTIVTDLVAAELARSKAIS